MLGGVSADLYYNQERNEDPDCQFRVYIGSTMMGNSCFTFRVC